MITQLHGKLLAIVHGAAHVQVGELVYEVLVPAADGMALAASLGTPVRFHTIHYMESQGQGSSFWPRLVGFQTIEEREFFDLFTTVKGIGNRKALRALQLPFERVAEAIAARDLALLQSLPEIGRRTAETICVELKGKVDRFVPGAGGGMGSTASVEAKPGARKGASGASKGSSAGSSAPQQTTPVEGAAPSNAQLIAMANGAVEVLVQLGHTRPVARELVERVLMRLQAPPVSAEQLVTAALE